MAASLTFADSISSGSGWHFSADAAESVSVKRTRAEDTPHYSFNFSSSSPTPTGALALSSSAGSPLTRHPIGLSTPAVSLSSSFNDCDTGSAYKMKLAVEADELRLSVEQLQDSLNRQRDDYKREKERLLRQLTFLEQDNAVLKKEASADRDKFFEEKKKWQARVRGLEAEVKAKVNASAVGAADAGARGTGRAVAVLAAEHDKLSQLEAKLLAKTEELQALTVSRQEQEDLISQLQRHIIDLTSPIRAVDENAPLHSQGSASYVGDSAALQEAQTEARLMRKRCSDLESKLRTKSRELEKLESRTNNQALLERELSAAQSRLQLLQTKLSDYQSLEAQHQVLIQEKAEWMDLFSEVRRSASGSDGGLGLTSAPSPVSVMRELSSLQQRCLSLSRSLGEADTEIQQLRKNVTRANSDISSLSAAKKDLELANAHLKSRVSIMHQQNSLYEGEIASLRQLVKSYDAEVCIGVKPHSDVTSASSTSSSSSGMIARLESSLKLKCEQLVSLQIQFDQCREISNEFKARLMTAEENISRLEAELKSARDSSSGGPSSSHGVPLDFNPSTTKVLHMSVNPASSVTKAHTSPAAPAPSAVSSSSATSIPAAPVDSGASATAGPDSNKLNQRLKEMFKERITAFREAVYLLTGFKVDLITADASTAGFTRLRLRSMYAEDPDDSLLFQWKGDVLQLLDTPFAEKLDSKSFAYLTTYNSVPAFLANTTLQLFDNQTFMGSH